jgi:hypothetical protein
MTENEALADRLERAAVVLMGYAHRRVVVDDTYGLLYDAAAALRAAEQREPDWRPIATAPKDRDMILTDGVQVAQGGWVSDMDQGADYEGQLRCAGWWSVPGDLVTPTHWMPLPAAPAAESENEHG